MKSTALYLAEMRTDHFTWRAAGANAKTAQEHLLALWMADPHTDKEFDTVADLDHEFGIEVTRIWGGWSQKS